MKITISCMLVAQVSLGKALDDPESVQGRRASGINTTLSVIIVLFVLQSENIDCFGLFLLSCKCCQILFF